MGLECGSIGGDIFMEDLFLQAVIQSPYQQK